MTRKLIKYLLPLLCFIVSSCTTLKEFPVNSPFDGIETALNRESKVNVFIVHGMGGFSEKDPDILTKTIEIQLSLQKCGPVCVRDIFNEETGNSYGTLTRQDYSGICSNKKVSIYVLDWTDTTWEEKSRLRYYDESCLVSKKRLQFISDFKKDSINNSIADTVLYLSSFKNEIYYPFAQSVRWIEEDSSDTPCYENIIVSFSLGGFIFVDALDNMQENAVESSDVIVKDFINHMSAFFSLSNSFPLFELANPHPKLVHTYNDNKECCGEEEEEIDPCDYLTWNWKQSPLGRFIHEKRATISDFQIVSISDPNDFLSYTACGYPVPSGDGCLNAFQNEDVRNVKKALFGYINPIDAHTGYGRNAEVLGMIIFGAKPTYCR